MKNGGKEENTLLDTSGQETKMRLRDNLKQQVLSAFVAKFSVDILSNVYLFGKTHIFILPGPSGVCLTKICDPKYSRS